MEFSDFELSLLLILVEQKISELKINRLDLSLKKRYFDVYEFNTVENNIISSIEAIECLKNKIKKCWRIRK